MNKRYASISTSVLGMLFCLLSFNQIHSNPSVFVRLKSIISQIDGRTTIDYLKFDLFMSAFRQLKELEKSNPGQELSALHTLVEDKFQADRFKLSQNESLRTHFMKSLEMIPHNPRTETEQLMEKIGAEFHNAPLLNASPQKLASNLADFRLITDARSITNLDHYREELQKYELLERYIGDFSPHLKQYFVEKRKLLDGTTSISGLAVVSISLVGIGIASYLLLKTECGRRQLAKTKWGKTLLKKLGLDHQIQKSFSQSISAANRQT